MMYEIYFLVSIFIYDLEGNRLTRKLLYTTLPHSSIYYSRPVKYSGSLKLPAASCRDCARYAFSYLHYSLNRYNRSSSTRYSIGATRIFGYTLRSLLASLSTKSISFPISNDVAVLMKSLSAHSLLQPAFSTRPEINLSFLDITFTIPQSVWVKSAMLDTPPTAIA